MIAQNVLSWTKLVQSFYINSIYFGWSYFELNGHRVITKFWNLLVQFLKMGYSTALEHHCFSQTNGDQLVYFIKDQNPCVKTYTSIICEHFNKKKQKKLKNHKNLLSKFVIKSYDFELTGALRFLSLLLNELSYRVLLGLEMKLFSSAN